MPSGSRTPACSSPARYRSSQTVWSAARFCERGGGGAVGEDGRPQLVGLEGGLGHELGAGQRRGRGVDVELERDERDDRRVRHAAGLEGGVQLGRDLLEPLRPVVEDPLAGIGRVRGVELGLELVEVLVGHRLQAGVRRHAEGEAGGAARGLVEQVAGRLGVAVGGGGVGRRLERGERDLRRQRRVRRRAAQVGIELDIGQVVDVDVDRRQDQRLAGVGGERLVAELGDADVELDVGRVDVPQVLELHAVGAGVAGQDEPRAADADGHVGLDGLLDLEAVGRDGHPAVGVGDLDVVQAVGGAPSGRTRRGSRCR